VVADQHHALGRRRRGERRRGPHQVIAAAGAATRRTLRPGSAKPASSSRSATAFAAGDVAGVRVDGDPALEQRQELGGARVGGGEGAIDEVGHRAAR
jgi:hypothetical protein